jgi:hypothetical protein
MTSAPDYEGDDADKFLARAFPWLLETTIAHRDTEWGALLKLQRIQADIRAEAAT